MRRQRLETPAAAVAHEVLAVRFHRPARLGQVGAGIGHAQHAAAQRQGVLDAAGDPRSGVGPDGHAIDHDLRLVLRSAVDCRRLVDRIGLPVDPDPHVAGGPRLFPERS